MNSHIKQQAWKSMNSILDTEMPVNKKRVYPLLPYLAAGIVIVALLSGSYYLYHSSSSSSPTPPLKIMAIPMAMQTENTESKIYTEHSNFESDISPQTTDHPLTPLHNLRGLVVNNSKLSEKSYNTESVSSAGISNKSPELLAVPEYDPIIAEEAELREGPDSTLVPYKQIDIQDLPMLVSSSVYPLVQSEVHMPQYHTMSYEDSAFEATMHHTYKEKSSFMSLAGGSGKAGQRGSHLSLGAGLYKNLNHRTGLTAEINASLHSGDFHGVFDFAKAGSQRSHSSETFNNEHEINQNGLQARLKFNQILATGIGIGLHHSLNSAVYTRLGTAFNYRGIRSTLSNQDNIIQSVEEELGAEANVLFSSLSNRPNELTHNIDVQPFIAIGIDIGKKLSMELNYRHGLIGLMKYTREDYPKIYQRTLNLQFNYNLAAG
jgi:hypothetical protein